MWAKEAGVGERSKCGQDKLVRARGASVGKKAGVDERHYCGQEKLVWTRRTGVDL